MLFFEVFRVFLFIPKTPNISSNLGIVFILLLLKQEDVSE